MSDLSGKTVIDPAGKEWTVSQHYVNADEFTLERDGDHASITAMDIAAGDYEVKSEK